MRSILLIPFALIILCGPLFAKDYRVTNVDIIAEVTESGVVHYSEARSYAFSGSFSQGLYSLPRRGFSEVWSFGVSEAGRPYVRSDENTPGTFEIRERRNFIDIIWYYEAEDEYRTFVIDFVLEGAIGVGPNHAEFFWRYLSNAWETPTENLQVKFLLPGYLGRDSRFWVRGASDKVTLETTGNGFKLRSTETIRSSESVSVRAVFPSAVISLAEVNRPDFSLPALIEEKRLQEEERERKAARKALWHGYSLVLIPFLSIASALIYLRFFMLYGRKHPLSVKVPEVRYTKPSNLPPALAGRFVQSVTDDTVNFTATIFDLARRGYFKLVEESVPVNKKGKTETMLMIHQTEKRPEGVLLEYESSLYDFLTEAMESGKMNLNVLFADKSKYAFVKKNSPELYIRKKTSEESYEWFTSWGTTLTKAVEKEGWTDTEALNKFQWSSLYHVVIVLASVFLLVMSANILALVPLIVASLFFMASLLTSRYLPEAQELHLNWKAYRNGLREGVARSLRGKDVADHIVYAIAFGLTGKKFENLIQSLDLKEGDLQWIMLSTSGVFNPAVISGSISNIATSMTTASSSFSGSGVSIGSAGGGAGGGMR